MSMYWTNTGPMVVLWDCFLPGNTEPEFEISCSNALKGTVLASSVGLCESVSKTAVVAT